MSEITSVDITSLTFTEQPTVDNLSLSITEFSELKTPNDSVAASTVNVQAPSVKSRVSQIEVEHPPDLKSVSNNSIKTADQASEIPGEI